MSEQQVEANEEQVEAKEAPQEEPKEESKEVWQKPPGWDRVEFDDLPEGVRDQLQQRINRIYGQAKGWEQRYGQLEKDFKAISTRLEEVEGTQVQTSQKQRLANIRQQKEAALAAGDVEKIRELDNAMEEEALRFAEEVKKPRQAEPEPTPEPTLPDEVVSEIQAWANEVDEADNFKRPWFQPMHRHFQQALSIADQVKNDPAFQGKGTGVMLKEIDRRIAATLPQRQSRTQTVLTEDASANPPKKDDIVLNNDQKYAAHRLYSHLSPKEAEARYIKSLKG